MSYHTLSTHDCFGSLNLPLRANPLSPVTEKLLLCLLSFLYVGLEVSPLCFVSSYPSPFIPNGTYYCILLSVDISYFFHSSLWLLKTQTSGFLFMFYFIFPTSLWLTSKERFAIRATLLWLDNKLIHLTANVSYPGASVSPLPI